MPGASWHLSLPNEQLVPRPSRPPPFLGPWCHCCGCQWHVSTVSSSLWGDMQRPCTFPADVPRAAVHPRIRTLKPKSSSHVIARPP